MQSEVPLRKTVEARKDRKRLSRIIKVDFGKEVGISLEELEIEFDEMIEDLELQVCCNARLSASL